MICCGPACSVFLDILLEFRDPESMGSIITEGMVLVSNIALPFLYHQK